MHEQTRFIESDDIDMPTAGEERLAANFAQLKEQQDVTDKEKLALETAVLIQQEIVAWEKSIAELENHLSLQNGDGALPPVDVVVVDEGEEPSVTPEDTL